MSKLKKVAIFVMIIIFAGIFVVCSYMLIKNFFDYKNIDIEISKLKDVFVDINEKDNIIIDWETLESINSDIVGWIKINDTNIDYPIMKDKDLYYINHTYKKKYNKNGSIFTKTNNPFNTEETIIYGHNNKNHIMFGDIEKYMDENFFYNHNIFKIYTKSQNYNAKVFSIYSIGAREECNNIKSLNFDECIEYYKKQSKFNVENQNEKKIIKLSTCSYLNNKATPTNQRYYLIAFLENIE